MINSSPPSATYMHQRIGPSFIQVMACRLFGAKPLPEPMLAYWQLDSWEQISVKFESEFYHFHSRKCTWKCRLPKWWSFCWGGWVNSLSHGGCGFDFEYVIFKPVVLMIIFVSISSVSALRWMALHPQWPYRWYVNIGSGKGLVLSGTKPLPEPNVE